MTAKTFLIERRVIIFQRSRRLSAAGNVKAKQKMDIIQIKFAVIVFIFERLKGIAESKNN